MMCVCCVSLCLSLAHCLRLVVRSHALPIKAAGDLTGNAVQIARGPPGIAPGTAAGTVHAKCSLQIAPGPPGTRPGHCCRHFSRQVVLANWMYDMMCVSGLLPALFTPSGPCRSPSGNRPGDCSALFTASGPVHLDLRYDVCLLRLSLSLSLAHCLPLVVRSQALPEKDIW